VSLNAEPCHCTDRSVDRLTISSMCPISIHDRLVASSKRRAKTFGATTNVNTVGLFLFPNGYDLVQRSVEAASKSRGAATPTQLLCLLLREQIIMHGTITACSTVCTNTRKLAYCSVLTRLCPYACGQSRPPARDKDGRAGRLVLSHKSRFLYSYS
jgi:hypothetical protein